MHNKRLLYHYLLSSFTSNRR